MTHLATGLKLTLAALALLFAGLGQPANAQSVEQSRLEAAMTLRLLTFTNWPDKDSESAARPIRIGLPIDTSPAGLRKFDKNTAFVISSTLCGQIQRAKGLTLGDLVRSVLPWPLHKDLSVPDKGPCKTAAGPDLGMICSLSIPIVTICALILLMIIVNLLDIIFRWIPYFIMCFPIPGLSGKSKPSSPPTP